LKKDIQILRELVKELNEIVNNPIQDERRNLWRKHNSLKRIRPLIYVRAFAFHEIFNEQELKCEDPFFRQYEYYIHMMKFRDTIGDDYIIEPWLTVKAVFDPPQDLRWGIRTTLGEKPKPGGAAAFKPEIIEEEDIEKLVIPEHKINEKATMERLEKLKDAVGDLIEIDLERGSIFGMWAQDISTDLAKLRGLEQIMWDAYDRPEWFHKLLSRMRDTILKIQEEAEKAGDYSLTCHQNQAMPYAEELDDPKPNIYGISRKNLWTFMASQEFTTFGPDMFYEFMLQYQMPIMEKYGLVAYGCCEDLTQKIEHLRKIPNLRRIAVSPFANAKKCAEQIGKDYMLSWRPDPSTMISTGLDEDFVRKHMQEHFKIFKENGNYFDITLKDVETISNKTENVNKWVKIVREEIEKCF
jgi:hypothetical protein